MYINLSMQPVGFRHGPKHGVTAWPEHGTARLANMPVPAHGTQQAVLGPLPRPAGRHGTARKSTGGTVRPGGEGRPADREGGIYKPPSQRPGAPQTLIPILLGSRAAPPRLPVFHPPLALHTRNPNPLTGFLTSPFTTGRRPSPASVIVLHSVLASTAESPPTGDGS